MTIIIAIETTNQHCSAALVQNGEIINSLLLSDPSMQCAKLFELIDQVMMETPKQNLDAIAVTTGPGSFTGIRIGLAAAKGINLALHKPIIGLTNLEVMAYLAQTEYQQTEFYCVMSALREQFYVQKFSNHAQFSAQLIQQDEVSGLDTLQIVTPEVIPMIQNSLLIPVNAESLGKASFGFLGRKSNIIEPFYLRNHDAIAKF